MQTSRVHALRQLIVEDELGGGGGKQTVVRGLGGVTQYRPDRQKNTQTGGTHEPIAQNRQAAEGEAGDKERGVWKEILGCGGGQPSGEGARRRAIYPRGATPPP